MLHLSFALPGVAEKKPWKTLGLRFGGIWFSRFRAKCFVLLMFAIVKFGGKQSKEEGTTYRVESKCVSLPFWQQDRNYCRFALSGQRQVLVESPIITSCTVVLEQPESTVV